MQRTFGTCGQRVAVAAAAVILAACTLEKQTQPSLIGPAEGGLSITMTALPDSLPRDGSSQSVVTLTARDSQGRPIAGRRLSLSLGINAPQGSTISATEVTTGSNGEATFAVGAPIAGSLGDITVIATPVGSDASNIVPRQISIRALPKNNAAPQFPNPPFNVSCANGLTTNCTADPEVGQTVVFDATGVTDEGVSCNSCTFSWNFGGEGTATGQIVGHAFGSGGTFVVTLTVTDSGGISNSAQRNINVSSPGPASVDFNFAPTPVIAGQAATFTATTTPAPNHRIVSYSWSWGDGTSSQTSAASIQHTYATYGPFLVSLTVRDDLSQSSTAYKPITVSSGLTAAFTTNKSGTTVTFDASTSSSQVASTITDYAWDFESDGTYDSNGSSPITSRDYGSNGTYKATLRITDNRGVTATSSATITIP
jgi:plastocyanin